MKKVILLGLFFISSLLFATTDMYSKVLSSLYDTSIKREIIRKIEDRVKTTSFSYTLEADVSDSYSRDPYYRFVRTDGINSFVVNEIARFFSFNFYDFQNSYHDSIEDYEPTVAGKLANNSSFVNFLANYGCPYLTSAFGALDVNSITKLKENIEFFRSILMLNLLSETSHSQVAEGLNISVEEFKIVKRQIEYPGELAAFPVKLKEIQSKLDATNIQSFAFLLRRHYASKQLEQTPQEFEELKSAYRECTGILLYPY